jgi:CheY-like chemotaxis protein
MTRESPHTCGILVVDDDRDTQELLRVALTSDGCSVAAVSDGREALDYLRSHATTCVIVLDLMLPDMDGARFRAVQLRDRSLAWIPVVVMSGALDADRSARELRAQALVRKPLDLDELRRAIFLVTRNNCRSGRPSAELAARQRRPLSSR